MVAAGEVDPRVQAEQARYGGDFDYLVGQWVSWRGTVDHFRGRILRVTYPIGLPARFFFDVLYAQANCANTVDEHSLEATAEFPVMMSEMTIMDLGPMFKTLPRE